MLLLFFRTGSIFVNKVVSLFTKDGLKGATAPRTVYRRVLRPPGISAVEIAKFHAATIASCFFPFYPFPPGRVHRFPVVIPTALMYETSC